MQACGNDFVVIDNRQHAKIKLVPEFIQLLADRHRGIGFDSLLTLSKPKDQKKAAFYQVFNADGSQAGQCGNGARCIAQFLFDESKKQKKHFTLETMKQPIQLEIIEPNLIKADLAIPEFGAEQQPINLPAKTEQGLTCYQLSVADQDITFYAVSLGNPHAVLLVEDLEQAPVDIIGKALNEHEAFPEGINVSFVEKENEHSIKVRVYERGVGETLACGSGACASALVSMKLNKATNPVQVFLPGGMVQVDWDGAKPVSLTGPAQSVFVGTWMNEESFFKFD
jgi:diaminopimelate epimerase